MFQWWICFHCGTGCTIRENAVINLKEKYGEYPVFEPFVHIKNNLLVVFSGFLVGQCKGTSHNRCNRL